MLENGVSMEKLEHLRHILLFEYNRGAKAGRCVVMGTIPLQRTRQENGFLALRRINLTLVTLHVQEDLRV